MTDPRDYVVSSTNWRFQLKRNERRTRIVIALFILLYVALGLLVDVVLQLNTHHSVQYMQSPYGGIYAIANPPLTAGQALLQLLTLKATPYATLITGGVALISIWVTFKLYDKLMLLGTEAREITPETTSSLAEKQLYHVVEEMKVAAGLHYMPKVYIIEAAYMNAFATGYSEKSALVAITRGLMDKLTRAEMQAVMAHELSHVRHLDIKLTLMASVLTNIMLIVIDLLFRGALYGGRRNREGNRLLIFIMVLRFVLPIVTLLLMMYLSRTREYLADAGAIELMRDNRPLASALMKIHHDHTNHQQAYDHAYRTTAHESVRRAAYIYDPSVAGIRPNATLASLFSTHPKLEARLAAMGIQIKS